MGKDKVKTNPGKKKVKEKEMTAAKDSRTHGDAQTKKARGGRRRKISKSQRICKQSTRIVRPYDP